MIYLASIYEVLNLFSRSCSRNNGQRLWHSRSGRRPCMIRSSSGHRVGSRTVEERISCWTSHKCVSVSDWDERATTVSSTPTGQRQMRQLLRTLG